MNSKGSAWIAWVFLIPVLLVMGLLVFYPLIKGISFSFTDMNQQNMGNMFAPPSYKYVGLENYKHLLGSFFEPDSVFRDVIIQTFVWTFTNVFFHFTIGLALALLLNRKIKGRAIYRTLLMVPWAVPSFVGAFSWLWMYNDKYGFFNQVLKAVGLPTVSWLGDSTTAMIAVILVNVWLGVPFMMVTMLGGLQSIPESLYEAARVEGASAWKQFTKITLPLLRPVAATATTLGIIWTFNMFNIIYLVTGGGPVHSTEILVTYAYQEAFRSWNLGVASTYGVVILSFLVAFTLFYQRVLKSNQNEGMYY